MDDTPFTQVKSEIRNADGSIVFDQDNITVPGEWSQVACDILAQKYFRKGGVPLYTKRVEEEEVPEWLRRSVSDTEALKSVPEDQRFTRESDARAVFNRMAGAWTWWGWKADYFDGEEDARTFFEEIRYMLCHQMAAPNSPQWFNTGLHWAYGLEGPSQGHFYVDPRNEELTESDSAYEHPQVHACFIQSIEDDLVNEGGIMDLWMREARLFKYGSGSGTNFSSLRGMSEKLSGGGYSSGLMSFLKIGDRAAGSIKSGGTTRRAAKMVCLDIDHPDIEEFIDWKLHEEQKVACLIAGSKVIQGHIDAITRIIRSEADPDRSFKLARAITQAQADHIPNNQIRRIIQIAEQGSQEMVFETYDSDWESKAYQTISGQNANNSVRVSNGFLEAVEGDREWDLRLRTRDGVKSTVSARGLWDRIAYAAWSCADPGLQFDTTINEWHTCPESGRINASNPCSEYMFLDDTACNLASLNLLKFVDEEGTFDSQGFRYACRLWTIVLEISVLMAQYPSARIARRSYEFRTLGLGYANLGGLLMVNGVGYDSVEGRALCSAITGLMCGVGYETSAEMAREFGSFPLFPKNREAMLRVIRNHRRAIFEERVGYENLSLEPIRLELERCPQPGIVEEARQAWDRALRSGEEYGFRNAQITAIAPTGTIGLVMDCDTTGIEPDYALVKFKKLAGGGYFKIINRLVPRALKRLGYSDQTIDRILAHVLGHKALPSDLSSELLKKHGFTETRIAAVERALQTTFDLKSAFNPSVLGRGWCLEALKVPEAELDSPGFNLLTFLGFNAESYEKANTYCCGTMTVEGAADLDV